MLDELFHRMRSSPYLKLPAWEAKGCLRAREFRRSLDVRLKTHPATLQKLLEL